MKDFIRKKVLSALAGLKEKNGWEVDLETLPVGLEEPANPDFGHLAATAALTLAKRLRAKPRDLAAMIVAEIKDPEGLVQSMEIAGPGFVNFRLSQAFWAGKLREIRAAGSDYGRGAPTGRKIQVEFVSANPTGPLHVGHGRGAALGDALARILSWLGNSVEREYYVNDAGRQMRILGNSVLVRIQERRGENPGIPEDFYKGDYIKDLAAKYEPGLAPSFFEKPRDERVAVLSRMAASDILDGIKADLADFRVDMDEWYSERSLFERGLVEDCFKFMAGEGLTYEEDGALWFKSVPFGDDKNRVLRKSGGELTYFASDVAYHKDKFDRGYDLVVDVWGADHHGYIPRVKAAVQAAGRDRDSLSVVLVQMVNLLRDGQAVNMSTRSGEFVTLREVVDEVGADAARFIFLTRSHESALDFDLDLAKTQTKDNPVFYVQYVCARISSLTAKAAAAVKQNVPDLSLLTEGAELDIIRHLAAFPEVVANSGRRLEPHLLTAYLTALARQFHQYYGAHRLVDDGNPALSAARLELAAAIRQVAAVGLGLLGVGAPEKM
ncbi:MAG: arginine--tRNA ligase [Deltaproteobacteria bacterium]|jgi:arginyl-tRNA synthetase|nr:arginine--tRNA ligase [Deltaproteobacteria bacterium]